MFRNQYDTDVTVWSPQGRLHQVEYAMEAVKQGSACVGLRSNDFAVLVDDHCGVVGSGLAADSSVLCKFMRKECMSFRYVYNGDIPVNRLVLKVADKCQECTQNAGSRPFGVGFLVAGYDQAGPHIFQTCPSGNYFEYKAYTIGARSQASKTFLEMHVDSFANMPRDTLILQGLLSLKASLQSGELDASNCTVAVVGKDQPFKIFDGAAVQPFIDSLDASEMERGAPVNAMEQ